MTFNSEYSQSVLDAVRNIGKERRLRADTLKHKLCERTGLLPLQVEDGIRDLHRRGLLIFQANARGQPVSGYVDFVRENVFVSREERFWRDALSLEMFDTDAIELLAPVAPRFVGMTEADIQALAKCLAALRGSVRPPWWQEVGSNLSARMVMGSAKVIAALPPKALTQLRLDPCLQAPAPRYVMHAGPDQLIATDTTLLIENPQAFENAIAAGLAERISLVCTFGFALSYLGKSRLMRAEMPTHERPIVLQRSGGLRSVDELFAAKQVLFWGDLDIGALKIFLACRSRTPALQLSAIYRVMEQFLDDLTRSHPYAEIFDKAGQARLSAFPDQVMDLEPEVKALFRRCARRGVDQEIVDISDIAKLGGLAY